MKKVRLKKFSILSLILIAASAVTATVLPKKARSFDLKNGELKFNTCDPDALETFTCVPGAGHDCHVTVLNDLTRNSTNDSTHDCDLSSWVTIDAIFEKQTIQNTSRPSNGYLTSAVTIRDKV